MGGGRREGGAVMAAWLGLLALAFVWPTPLAAGKKKNDTPPPPNPADQRAKGYFDVSKIVWPNPPAITRIAFKEVYTGEKIDPSLYALKKHKSSWMDRLAGSQPADEARTDKIPFQLVRTYGVGVDSKGKIYAADQAVGAVFVFDPDNKDHVEMIANSREANLPMVAGLALDDDDRLFLTDAKLRHVLVFNPKHQQEAVFGTEVLVHPGGIAIDSENRFVYVADTGNDVVDVFDADNYKFLRQIGKPSRKHNQAEPGTFSLPEGVAVDKEGNVFVADTVNNRIEMFDADGQFVSTFGKAGDGPADFERPRSIAVDCDGHLWVVDAGQNMVKVFDQQGRLLIYFGEQGYYPGQFMGPWGITIGPSNQVVVSETFPGRVQVFRYITDAEAEAERARREAAAKPAARQPQDAGAARPAGPATTEQTKPASEPSPAHLNQAARKDVAAP